MLLNKLKELKFLAIISIFLFLESTAMASPPQLDPQIMVEAMVSKKVLIDGVIINRVNAAFRLFGKTHKNIEIKQCIISYREYEGYYIVGIGPKAEIGVDVGSELKIPRGVEMLFRVGDEDKCLKEIPQK